MVFLGNYDRLRLWLMVILLGKVIKYFEVLLITVELLFLFIIFFSLIEKLTKIDDILGIFCTFLVV